MKVNLHGFRRSSYGLLAVVVTTVTSFSVLLPQFASAGQVTSRSVQMSDSAPSGGSITSGVGSGANVSYNITFTAPTSATVGGIVVDICDSTPLIGDTSCTLPTGFGWGNATPAATVTGITGTWTASSSAGGGTAGQPQVLFLSDSAPAIPGGAVNIVVTGVNNPSTTNHTFYARIVTFNTAANMTSNYTVTGTTRAASFAGSIDNGGVAMSTATPISITARVMESLSLCTSAAAPTANCAGVTAPSIILGHGANNVLDASAIDTKSVYSQLSTNAASGAIIRMHASSTCGGLSKDGGATCPIPAFGAVLGTFTAGTADFGVQTQGGTAVAGGSGSATLNAKYANAASSYAMDITTANNNVTATYGDSMASTAGAVNSVNVQYVFAATAANTTPAGIYTVNESLIATGTF